MPTAKKRENFFTTEEGIRIEQALRQMEEDIAYNTESSYNANGDAYPDNVMSFVDKHMTYLNKHQNLNPQHYLSNLRLMTRLK